MGAGLHYLVVMTAEGYQDKGFLFLCKGGVERGASTGLRFLVGILGNGMGWGSGGQLCCHPLPECGPPEDIIHGKKHGDCTSFRYRSIVLYELHDYFSIFFKSFTRLKQGEMSKS